MSVSSKALTPILIAAVAVISGCADYGRVAPDSEDPFNSTTLDSKDIEATIQLMARAIVKLPQFASTDKPPTVAFAEVVNNGPEPIDTELFLEQIRELLMEHAGGKIAFLNRALSEAVLRERDLKRRGEVTSSSRKAVGGADFFLAGTIRAHDKGSARLRSTYTLVNFNLTDAESMQIIWGKTYKVKKTGKQAIWDR